MSQRTQLTVEENKRNEELERLETSNKAADEM